ncbi:organic solute transporter subunit alpha-like [Glandiceps talaboti]
MADNTSDLRENESLPCADYIPYANEVIPGATTALRAILVVVPVLAVISVALFFEAVYYLRNKIPTKLRRNKLIWVIGVYPVFSVTSCIGLFIPRATLLTNFTASIYLSITLYMFLMLIVDYFGGSDAMYHTMNNQEVNLNEPPLLACCVCLPKIRVTPSNGPWLRRLVLQNALLRPLILFIAVVLWLDGRYLPGKMGPNEPYLWLSVLSIISTITAMQTLGIIHGASKVTLKDYKITFKFVTIQCTLIFGNIQLGLLTILSNVGIIPCRDPFNTQARVYNIYNVLVICEFFILAIFSRILFRTRNMGNSDHVIPPEKAIEEGLKPVAYTVKNDKNYTGENEKGYENQVMADIIASDQNANKGTS